MGERADPRRRRCLALRRADGTPGGALHRPRTGVRRSVGFAAPPLCERWLGRSAIRTASQRERAQGSWGRTPRRGHLAVALPCGARHSVLRVGSILCYAGWPLSIVLVGGATSARRANRARETSPQT